MRNDSAGPATPQGQGKQGKEKIFLGVKPTREEAQKNDDRESIQLDVP
jgi:hypothetical protein